MKIEEEIYKVDAELNWLWANWTGCKADKRKRRELNKKIYDLKKDLKWKN